ncbi:MAG: hypothetical protein GF335_04525 [Candidatus Moranbacteria bacterium]|nr:hypothetical protein [Candidatus Moranbacteria bacterium]
MKKINQIDKVFLKQVIYTLIYLRIRKIPATNICILKYLFKNKNFYLDQKNVLISLRIILDFLINKGKVVYEFGAYYWIFENEFYRKQQFYKNAIELKKNSFSKIKIARKICRILKYLPFIKLIGINGTVALGNARKKSDIDFFVICKDKRIWTTRLLMIIILEILDRRKKKGKNKDRICLNSFANFKNLEFRYQDRYSALELLAMLNIIDRDNCYTKLVKENLPWIKKYFAINDLEVILNKNSLLSFNLQKPFIFRAADFLFGLKIFNFIEQAARLFQEKRIKKKAAKLKKGQVYWSDDALIFHPKPKSRLYQKKFLKRLKKEKKQLKELFKAFKI